MIGKEGKKGQVTIFIIIGILIVALGVLIYSFYPELKAKTSGEAKSPSAFIQDCMQEKIQETVEIISSQGGSVEPGFFFQYYSSDEEKTYDLEYLCYTGEYYSPCSVQQPMLIPHIQDEIKNEIKSDAKICFDNLKKSYLGKGYSADLEFNEKNIEVKLLPEKVITDFKANLTLTKGDTQKYEAFTIILDNDLYLFAALANSIIIFETQFGEARCEDYMNYYHNLKCEQYKQLDGSVIYILSDRENGNAFQFAIRSYVFPPGY